MIRSARKRRLLFSVARGAIATVLLLFAVALGKGAYNMYGIMSKSRSEARETRERYEELRMRHENARRALDELATPYGKEAVLRERFGVAAPGEVVIILTEAQKDKATTTDEFVEEKGWFSRLFSE